MESQSLNKEDYQSHISIQTPISNLQKKVILNKFLSNSVFDKSIQSETYERDLCIITNGKMRNKHVFSIGFKEINFKS